jgi:hypothetical protein
MFQIAHTRLIYRSDKIVLQVMKLYRYISPVVAGCNIGRLYTLLPKHIGVASWLFIYTWCGASVGPMNEQTGMKQRLWVQNEQLTVRKGLKLRWRKVKDGQFSDVMYTEVKWKEVKRSEVMWSEVKRSEVKWREVKWREVKWCAPTWSEVMCAEVK